MSVNPPPSNSTSIFNLNSWVLPTSTTVSSGLSVSEANNLYLSKSGGTITGDLTINGSETVETDAILNATLTNTITTQIDGDELFLNNNKTFGDLTINYLSTGCNTNIASGDLNLNVGNFNVGNGNISFFSNDTGYIQYFDGSQQTSAVNFGNITAITYTINGTGAFNGNALSSLTGSDLLLTASTGQNVNINSNRVGQSINMNVGGDSTNDVNIATGDLTVSQGLIKTSSLGIEFPGGTQTLPFTGSSSIITGNYTGLPGTTETINLPTNTIFDVIVVGGGGTSGNSAQYFDGSATSYYGGGAGGGGASVYIPNVYINSAVSMTITYNLDLSITISSSLPVLNATASVGGNGGNASTSPTRGTGGTGGSGTGGAYNYAGVNGSQGAISSGTAVSSTPGYPVWNTQSTVGRGGYSTANSGNNFTKIAPGNAGVSVVQYL